MEGVLFGLSGIAIIHFDDMQKTHPFTYLPNKFLETRRKPRKTPDLEKYLEGKKRRFVNYTQRAFSVYTDIRKLQDKAKTSYL